MLVRGLEVSQRVQRVIVYNYMMCFADGFTSIVDGENSIQDAGEVVGIFDEKCLQPSLKVNYEKTNTMKVLTAIPNDRLVIQTNSISCDGKSKNTNSMERENGCAESRQEKGVPT